MKKSLQSDSLDLLLDAMCNVFGAILLVAVLVTAISGTALLRGGGRDATAEERALREKITLRKAELAAAKAELELVEALAASRIPETPRSPAELAEALRSGETLAADNNLLGEKLLSLHMQKLENDRRLAAANDFAELSQVQKNRALAEKRQKLDDLQKTVAQAEAMPERFVPRTLQATNNLQPWRLWVGKEIHNVGSNRAIRALLPGNDAVQCTHFQLDSVDYWRLVPVAGRGTSVRDFDAEKLLKLAPLERYFMELLVTPDAISEAALVVQKMRRAGYRVNWRVASPEGALVAERKGGKYEAAQ